MKSLDKFLFFFYFFGILSSSLGGVAVASNKKYLDPEGVEREDIIALLGSRPKVCPLRRNNQSREAILLKLAESLKNFKCKNHLEGELLDLASKELKEISKKSKEYEEDLSVISGISDVFENLVQLKDRDECTDDFKKKSFLGRLADTVAGVSSLGILSSHEDSLWYVLGGMGVSSILRLIDRFFINKYEWSNYQDRMVYNNLSCSFYDIRLQLEQLNLFKVATPSHLEEKERLENELNQWIEEQKSLKQKITAWDQQIASKRQEFFTEKIDFQEKNIYEKIEKFSQELESTKGEEHEIVRFISFSIYGQEIYDLLNEKGLSGSISNNQTLQEISKTIHYMGTLYGSGNNGEGVILGLYRQRANFVEKERDDSVFSTHLNWLKALLGHALVFYKRQMERIEHEWSNSQDLHELQSQQKRDRELLAKKNREIESQKGKIAAFNNNLNGEHVLNDGGYNDLVSIYNDYQETVKKVYVVQNNSFSRYMKKELKDNLNDFKREYNVFLRRDYFNSVVLSGSELNRACVRAEHTLQSWGVAHSWSQYAFDFYMTNIDIFHDLRGYKKNVYEEAYSVLHARAMMDLDPLEGEEDKGEDFGALDASSVGALMLRIHRERVQAQALQEFVEKDCKEINSWRRGGRQ